MIRNNNPISMAEVLEYVKEDENGIVVTGFIKKFTKLSIKDAREMRKKLEELNLIKIKAEYIVKIIDLVPENQEELNKIFIDVSLNEDETNKILDIVKQFK